MATRMATLLGPPHVPATREGAAGADQVVTTGPEDRLEQGASVPPPVARSFVRPTLPAMVVAVAWTAVVWLGLAVFVIGLAYPFSIGARFWILMLGSWLVAGGLAYAVQARPEVRT